MSNNETTSNVVESLSVVIGELVEIINSEHKKIQIELDQVSSLIKDAEQTIKKNINSLDSVEKPNVVRALQFEDIVQQLVHHTNNRTETLVIMLNKLKEITTNTDHDNSLSQHVKNIKNIYSKFNETVATSNPVQQNSINEGKTELF